MEDRITTTELAKSLQLRAHISREEATNFVATFFATIEEQLLKDGVVKVKGFGTFKLMGVEGRESIDVNSGERILISAHTKVTFTPDAVLRDAVNKPFTDFTTVVLHEEREGKESRVEGRLLQTCKMQSRETLEEPQQSEKSSTSATPPLPDKKMHTWPWLLLCFSCIVFGGIVGFVAGLSQTLPVVTYTPSPDSLNTITEVVPMDTMDTIVPVDSSQFYPQVPNGEYLIVGELSREVMRPGKTLLKLSRKYYEGKELVEYICTMNNIEDPDVIARNDTIVIPKLLHKDNTHTQQ